MSQYNESAVKTFVSSAALGANLRVKLAAGVVSLAGATDAEVGTVVAAVFAASEDVAVRLRTAQGTCMMVASVAITAGNPCYAAAGGKIAASGTILVGEVLQASTADGDVVEVLRVGESSAAAVNGKSTTVEKHTAGDTLLAAESGSVHSNTGAAGTITLVLPAAVAGMTFDFYVGAAQQLRIDPAGSETIALPSTGVQGAAGKYLVADAVGEFVRLVCETTGSWIAFPYSGTWTAEA